MPVDKRFRMKLLTSTKVLKTERRLASRLDERLLAQQPLTLEELRARRPKALSGERP